VGPSNEYQPKGGDALRLGSKDRYGLFAGKTVCCENAYGTYKRFTNVQVYFSFTFTAHSTSVHAYSTHAVVCVFIQRLSATAS